MPISSDSLFHLTSSIDTLKKILSGGFLVSVSSEGMLLEKRPYDIYRQMAIPMVCFCDIPLGQIQGHSNLYSSPQGAYGIGLTRDWGLSRKCTPVSYVHEHSPLLADFETINAIFSEFTESNCPGGEIDYYDYLVKSSSFQVKRFIRGEVCTRTSFRAFLYVKSYRGYYYRNGQIIKDPFFDDYNFYNEREWRYVPPEITSLPEFVYPPYIEDRILQSVETLSVTPGEMKESHEWYTSEVDKLKQNRRFLSFSAADITHLIVNEEDEARELIDFLWDYKNETFGGEIFDKSQKSALISKITRYSDLKVNVFSG